MASGGQDGKFFSRGKLQEIREDLTKAIHKGDKKWEKRKAILKKVVANMTMGNDMSPIWNEIMECLGTPLFEVKKMIYLYVMNYGRMKADHIELAIKSLLFDANGRNPLLRALAIRTLCYIPLAIAMQNACEPLRHCMKDSDPYVRKTASICVAKMFQFDPRLTDREGLVSLLRQQLADENTTVVANAAAALTEISERGDRQLINLTAASANKLVASLGESSEWGQVYITDALMYFVPQSTLDAMALAQRLAVRLQHNSSAVVLVTIKILLYLMNYIDDRDEIEQLCRRMGPPLVSLLSSGPEVQYVALRNILLIIQRRPSILRSDVKAFFAKYNDPIYVKLAKLEIMYRLATEQNYREVLAELQESASEIDVDFARRAVRSIGRLAIKVPSSSDRCIAALLDLIKGEADYVMQEATVVIKDIFRRYPSEYESVIPTLCEQISRIANDPESKAAMAWIIGQYADRIDDAHEHMEYLCEDYLQQPKEVQFALLTAVVKLFIRRPANSQELVSNILKLATEELDNPDLRDRGFMYWRLLHTSTEAAKEIVLADMPPISTDTDRMERGALDQLLLHTSTLGSIYHKNPETFVRNAKPKYLTDSPALNPQSRAVLVVPPDLDEPTPQPAPASLIPRHPSHHRETTASPTLRDIEEEQEHETMGQAREDDPSEALGAGLEYDPYAALGVTLGDEVSGRPSVERRGEREPLF